MTNDIEYYIHNKIVEDYNIRLIVITSIYKWALEHTKLELVG